MTTPRDERTLPDPDPRNAAGHQTPEPAFPPADVAPHDPAQSNAPWRNAAAGDMTLPDPARSDLTPSDLTPPRDPARGDAARHDPARSDAALGDAAGGNTVPRDAAPRDAAPRDAAPPQTPAPSPVTPDYAPRRAARRGPPPLCGACGYDTTGLTSLVCPECGADLRAAGITRGRPAGNTGAFLASLFALLLAWVVCSFPLATAVDALVPVRHEVEHTTRLANPRSRAYFAVDVVATGTAWGESRPALSAELRLVPAAPPPGGPGPAPVLPPAASPSTPTAPRPLTLAPGLHSAAVLSWLAAAGVDTTDPRVHEEARRIALTAARATRSRERLAPGFGTSRTMSQSGGTETPFGSVITNSTGRATRSHLYFTVLAALWTAVLLAAVAHLWRTTHPRGLPQ